MHQPMNHINSTTTSLAMNLRGYKLPLAKEWSGQVYLRGNSLYRKNYINYQMEWKGKQIIN